MPDFIILVCFFDIVIAIFVILKSNNNDWLVILILDFTLKGDTPIVPDLDFEKAMLDARTILIKLTY